ncbi:MAG: response regulator [Chryseolinea sp.]
MDNTEIEILLVEDTLSDAEMTVRALRKNKIANHIVHLNDGKEALDFLFGSGKYIGRDVDKKPKVILLDLKMPRISGIEVLRKIKNDELTKRIPVVVLTSSNEDPDINECYRLGVNSYIVKPVSSDDFMRAVGELGLYWVIHNQTPR